MNVSASLWAGSRGINTSNLPKSILDLRPIAPWSAYQAVGAPPAAVVMLFIPGKNDESPAQLVLTRRSLHVRTHKGQIGLPGGRAERDDATPAATAVRELEEELGVPRGLVQVHGVLPPLPSLDGRPVVTVLSTANLKPGDFTPAPDEVESVLFGPWTSFTRERDQSFEFNLFGNWRQSHLFHLAGEKVWGLTAKILFDADLR